MTVTDLISLVARATPSMRRQKPCRWVEYLSPGRLRAGEDDFALVYHDGERQHFFYGKVGKLPSPDILTVPSELKWQSQVPVWMREERVAILKRIGQEFSRVQVVEMDAE